MNDEFSRVLSQQMDHFSNDPNADRLNRLKGEMNQASTEHYRIDTDLSCSFIDHLNSANNRYCFLPTLSNGFN